MKPPLSLPAASSAGGGRASNDRISRTIEERAASAPVQLPRSLSKPARSLSIGGAARRPGARRRRRGEPAGWAVRPGSPLGVPESARLFCPRGDRGQFDQAAPLHLDCIPAARSPPHRRVPPPLSGGQRSGSSSLSQSYRRSSSHGHVSLLLGASPAASGGGSVPPTLLGAAGGATSCGLLQQCRAAGAASPDPPTRRHASLVPSAAAAPPVTACAVAIAQMRHPCSPTGARDDTYTAGPTCVAAAIHCIRSPRVHATRRIHCTRLTPSVSSACRVPQVAIPRDAEGGPGASSASGSSSSGGLREPSSSRPVGASSASGSLLGGGGGGVPSRTSCIARPRQSMTLPRHVPRHRPRHVRDTSRQACRAARRVAGSALCSASAPRARLRARRRPGRSSRGGRAQRRAPARCRLAPPAAERRCTRLRSRRCSAPSARCPCAASRGRAVRAAMAATGSVCARG